MRSIQRWVDSSCWRLGCGVSPSSTGMTAGAPSVNRETKASTVELLVREFEECDALFIADYRGLDMPSITELRASLTPVGGRLRVVKNTLARRAADQAGLEGLSDMFRGPTAVTFVKGDAAAVAKALDKAAKQHEAVELRGGMMDGRAVDVAQVKEIAKLPAREVILAMFVGALNGPLTQAVGVLAAPTRDIVQLLDNYIEKRRGEEESAA